MPKYPATTLLSHGWVAFTKAILDHTEEDLVIALLTEKAGRARPQYLRRLQARISRLRSRREKVELAAYVKRKRKLK